jgi:hypothetical protein
MALDAQLPTPGPEQDGSIPPGVLAATCFLASVLVLAWWLW